MKMRFRFDHNLFIPPLGLAAVICLSLRGLPALAQDVPGIEICTRESRLDRRTGCLQSNVEFLQQVVTKNALDAQQKLNAANRDIVALRDQLAAANRDLAALRDALSGMQARLDQLQKATASAGPQARPDAKPETRPDPKARP